MELILINASKLKIMLTPEDMTAHSLNCDKINYDNTETRRAFWDILDEAKHKTGFDAAADRVFIQVYPSKGGGCEMYVTKLTHSEACPKTECSVEMQRGAGPEDVYVFESFEALTAFCRRLINGGYKGESRCYTDNTGKKRYFLAVRTSQSISVVASEYGKRVLSSVVDGYIGEYCAIICVSNAVETLYGLA